MSYSKEFDEYEGMAEFYDSNDAYRNRTDTQFFIDMAKEAGGPVLELGCGTGRVLIPTATAGVEIVGLDLSHAMLNRCRLKLAAEPAAAQTRATLVQGDMREFDLKRQFKLITIPFRPFQHLVTVEEQLACLRCLHRHLVPGGRLILDLFNPSLPHLVDESRAAEREMTQFSLPDGRRVTRKDKVESNLLAQVLNVQLIYYVTHPDGREERVVNAFPMRYFFRYEAEHLLARCGFEIENVYCDYEKHAYGEKYPGELIFVARKN